MIAAITLLRTRAAELRREADGLDRAADVLAGLSGANLTPYTAIEASAPRMGPDSRPGRAPPQDPPAAPQESGPALPASPSEAPAAPPSPTTQPPAPEAVGPCTETVTTVSALPGVVAASPTTSAVGPFAPRPTRADAVLSVLTDAPQRHPEIARAAASLGVPQGSLGDALYVLRRRQLVVRDKDGRYRRATTAIPAPTPDAPPCNGKDNDCDDGDACTVDDFDTARATTATRARTPLPHGELARRILDALTEGPQSPTRLAAVCDTTIGSMCQSLMYLRRRGQAENPARGVWRLAEDVSVVRRTATPTPAPEPSMTPPPVKSQSRGKGKRRSVTLPSKRLSRIEIAAGAELVDVDTTRRPKTRADCVNGLRPCIWVACHHHLAMDVDPRTGSIKVNFPGALDGDFSAMAETCALDVADRDGATLEAVADVLALTRERVRQVEEQALERVRDGGDLSADDARGLGREEVA